MIRCYKGKQYFSATGQPLFKAPLSQKFVACVLLNAPYSGACTSKRKSMWQSFAEKHPASSPRQLVGRTAMVMQHVSSLKPYAAGRGENGRRRIRQTSGSSTLPFPIVAMMLAFHPLGRFHPRGGSSTRYSRTCTHAAPLDGFAGVSLRITT